uniref:Uncharacterized protein n=1 Tax=Hyaloperonospora arabidopsidis (strain Emoy2) TaxID=559515 RepID=M4B9L0_HYAAE
MGTIRLQWNRAFAWRRGDARYVATMETNTGKSYLGYTRRTSIFTGRVVDCIRSTVEHRADFRRARTITRGETSP